MGVMNWNLHEFRMLVREIADSKMGDMSSARNFIPKSKVDTGLIEELSKYQYPFYKPILKELFEWIKDLNWPVAQPIIPLLVNAKADIIPIVKEILLSEDDIWKYWTLSQVVSEMDPAIIKELKPELDRLIHMPTKGEKMEEAVMIAEQLIEKFQNGNSLV